MAPSLPLPAVIRSVERLSPVVKRLTLQLHRREPPQNWFRPGQWADFWFAKEGSYAMEDYRDYSGPVGGYTFTSDARTAADAVEFCIQSERRPKGTTMTSWVHSDACRPGVEIMLRPGGQWLVELPAPGTKVVLVAAGIGITPFLSFARTFGDADLFASTELKYSVKRADDALFLDELSEALPTTLFLTGLSDADFRREVAELVPNTVAALRDQRMTVEDLVGGPRGGGKDAAYYLCGPPAFADETAAALRGMGCQRVLYENWWATPQH